MKQGEALPQTAQMATHVQEFTVAVSGRLQPSGGRAHLDIVPTTSWKRWSHVFGQQCKMGKSLLLRAASSRDMARGRQRQRAPAGRRRRPHSVNAPLPRQVTRAGRRYAGMQKM